MKAVDRLSLAAVCALSLAAASARAQDAAPIRTAAHVHSAYSGRSGPDMRTTLELARERGIQAVILADDAIGSFEYGLWPLRGLLKVRISRSSVLGAGPSLYLEHVAAMRKSFPDLIIVPGVEAAAFYHWSGDPLSGLTINDWNRHMSVAGLERPQDYEDLPVLGNRRAAPWRPLSLWPLLLLILAGGLLLARGRRAALLPAALGALFLLNNYPFRQARYDQYDPAAGWKPYQELARYADEKGFLSFWNHPEAPNWSAPQRLGWHVWARTPIYPECLQAVPQTDGFAALLEGDRTMTKPGRDWDRELSAYMRGRRAKPPWGFAELEYVGEGRGPGMGTVYMDVHAATRTAAGLLQALRAGRFESVAMDGAHAASLREWRVVGPGSAAASGETLKGAPRPSVRVALAPVGAAELPARVRLIRNGAVVFDEDVSLPFSRVIADDPGADKRSYYRLDVRVGANGALLSNPIFVFND